MTRVTRPPTAPRTPRDRRGRGVRGPLAWPAVPAMRTPAERFAESALAALDVVLVRFGVEADRVEVAVEDIPPHDPAPWEDGVPLARTFPGRPARPGRPGEPDRIVLYRRPLERLAQRHAGPVPEADLAEFVLRVLAEQVARLLGLDPDDLDDLEDPRGPGGPR